MSFIFSSSCVTFPRFDHLISWHVRTPQYLLLALHKGSATISAHVDTRNDSTPSNFEIHWVSGSGIAWSRLEKTKLSGGVA